MKRMYSPVALIVEDDTFAARHFHRGFLQDTSLGVLEANDLKTAYRYLHNPSLRIDVVVADVGFQKDTKYLEHNLNDGLDLIEEAMKIRPDLENYVLSIDAGDPLYHKRAKEKNLPIADWLEKCGVAASPYLLPWVKVERACLVKTLKRDRDFRDRAKAAGIDVRDLASDEAIAEKVRKALVLPRLTYLRQLPEDCQILLPIEVLCVQEGDESYRASAPHIGLITEAIGESVDDALENLGHCE